MRRVLIRSFAEGFPGTAWLRLAAHAVLVATALSVGVAGDCRAQRVSVVARPVFSITALDAEGAEPLGRVAGATLDSRDRVILADASLARIVAYDERGRPRLSSGRKGAGPGEYTMLEWIGSCLPGDSAVVYDLWRKEFSVLDSRLAFVRTIHVTETPSALTCAAVGSLYFLEFDPSVAPTDRTFWRGDAALRRMNLADGVVRTIVDHQPVADLLNMMGAWWSSPHGRRTSLAVYDQNVLVSSGDAAARTFFAADGDSLRSLKPVAWRAIAPTPATRQATADWFMSRVPDVAMANMLTKRLLAAPQEPIDVFYHRVLIDPLGAVWTQRSLPGEPEVRLEIESVNGNRLGSVTLPVNGDVLAVGRTRLVVLSEIDDAPAVLVYAIQRVP